VRSAPLVALALLSGGSLRAQDAPIVPPAAALQQPAPKPASPPQEPPPEPDEPPEADADVTRERIVGPSAGAPTLALGAAVGLALEHNFALLDSVDAVTGSRWQERAALGAFFPQLTPVYQRFQGSSVFGADLSQALPFSGGTLTAAGRYLSAPKSETPLTKTADLRLVLTQPLLRGFGPNASLFELRNARRSRVGQERGLELARQRVALEVAAAFYGVIAQRQLLDVARQSLARTQTLLRSSNARLEVGMASKLDVFRAELQAAQARDAMVRTEAALQTALERFRGLLALPPADPVEPEAAALPLADADPVEPAEAQVGRALATRLELAEVRDQVGDARRAASLARQNLLPQVDVNLAVAQLGYGAAFGEAWAAGDTRVELYLSAAYPLQQASQRAARAQAQLQVAGRERGVRQRELEVEAEVRQALRELEQIRKSVGLQRQAVEVATQQRRLAVLRYQRGLGSNFDVVDAESSLVTARSALVQLLTSYAVARLDLKRVTGSLDLETEFGR